MYCGATSYIGNYRNIEDGKRGEMKKNERENCACIVVQGCNLSSREDQHIIIGYIMSPRLAQATQGSVVRGRMGKERRKSEGKKTKTITRKRKTVVGIQHPARWIDE